MFSSIYLFFVTVPIFRHERLKKKKRAAFCFVFMGKKVVGGRYERSSLNRGCGMSGAHWTGDELIEQGIHIGHEERSKVQCPSMSLYFLFCVFLKWAFFKMNFCLMCVIFKIFDKLWDLLMFSKTVKSACVHRFMRFCLRRLCWLKNVWKQNGQRFVLFLCVKR